MPRELKQETPAKKVSNSFDCCHNVEHVLKIGREFQMQDLWRGAHHDTAKLLCDTIEYLYERLNGPIGNAAAMYDALVKIAHYCDDKDGMDDPYCADGHILSDIARAALATPPRNCEVGTPDEQAKRFHDFCAGNSSGINGMCKPTCPCIDCFDKCQCFAMWAQTPYEAQEGENNG